MARNEPRGKLTEAQIEILEVFWERDPGGATVTEVWEALRARREVARNTVLTMIGRLAKRGWLARIPGRRPFAYRVTSGREAAAERLAGELVDGFFAGSLSQLVMSLLGSRNVPAGEIARIRQLLDEEECS